MCWTSLQRKILSIKGHSQQMSKQPTDWKVWLATFHWSSPHNVRTKLPFGPGVRRNLSEEQNKPTSFSKNACNGKTNYDRINCGAEVPSEWRHFEWELSHHWPHENQRILPWGCSTCSKVQVHTAGDSVIALRLSFFVMPSFVGLFLMCKFILVFYMNKYLQLKEYIKHSIVAFVYTYRSNMIINPYFPDDNKGHMKIL